MPDENFLSGPWEKFESWIEAKVGGEFSWKVRPRDTKVNRMVVAKSVIETIERNDGRFPRSGNIFLQPERDEQHF